MWRLHRYLFFSTASIALASVGVIVLMLVAGNIFLDLLDKIDEGKVGSEVLKDLIPLLVPYAVSFAMPMGSLIAVLVVVGRLSASSELTALKASGISLWRVSIPLILFCLMGTVFTSWINATLAPSARASYKDMLLDAVRANPLRLIVPKQFTHDFPGYVVYVDAQEGTLIRDVWIWELDKAKRAVRLLRADAGTLTFDQDRDALVLKLEKGFVELRDEKDPDDLGQIQPSLFFDNLTIRLSLTEIFGAVDSREIKAANLSFSQKRERLSELRHRRALAAPEDQSAIRNGEIKVQFLIQSSFANAFSVLSLGLLAIPLGVKASRKETSINFFIAVGLTLLYYLATVIIGWMDKYPEMRPDLVIWLPNLVCQGLAVWLLFRANRH